MTRGLFVLTAVGAILMFPLVVGRGVASNIQITVGLIGCVLISMVGYKLCDIQEKLDAVSKLLAKQSEMVSGPSNLATRP